MSSRAGARRAGQSFELDVDQIEHRSMNCAEKSCDPIYLRVKRDLKFGCSMRWSNKQRSITELNSDSHRHSYIVSDNRRQTYETIRSCGLAPACKSGQSFSSRSASDSINAGHAPASLLPALQLLPAFCSWCASTHAAAPGAEFISVSGKRPERSALFSDMRSKRTSGFVAATESLHAPMNSPLVCGSPRLAGFPFNHSSQ